MITTCLGVGVTNPTELFKPRFLVSVYHLRGSCLLKIIVIPIRSVVAEIRDQCLSEWYLAYQTHTHLYNNYIMYKLVSLDNIGRSIGLEYDTVMYIMI